MREPETELRISTCPHCNAKLYKDVWCSRPEWLTMLIRTTCCNRYANVKWIKDNK